MDGRSVMWFDVGHSRACEKLGQLLEDDPSCASVQSKKAQAGFPPQNRGYSLCAKFFGLFGIRKYFLWRRFGRELVTMEL